MRWRWATITSQENEKKKKKGEKKRIPLVSRKTGQQAGEGALVVLDDLALSLVEVVIAVPEAGVEGLDDDLDLAAEGGADLALHVQALVARDHLIEARVEGLELLPLLVLVLGAQALDDRGAVDRGAGDGAACGGLGGRRGRVLGRRRRVDLVEQVDGDLLPPVHVGIGGALAPPVEFRRVRRDGQVQGQVGRGAHGAVEGRDAVG